MLNATFQEEPPLLKIRSDSPVPSSTRGKSRPKKHTNRNALLMGALFLLLILLLLICYFISNSSQIKPTSPNVAETSSVASQDNPVANPKKNIDLNAWNLLLVNNTHGIPASFAPVTQQLPNGKEVDARIYDSLQAMIADAKLEELNVVVGSAYRTYDYQTNLFKKQIKSVQNAEGVTKEEAIEAAGTVVAVPGTSEHQTGLSVDIITKDYTSLDEGILNTPEVKWLYKNCQNYGFIVRFPANTQNITGIIYEPWHYRYVGVEAATEIMERGITFEEYIAEIQAAQGIIEDKNALAVIQWEE